MNIETKNMIHQILKESTNLTQFYMTVRKLYGIKVITDDEINKLWFDRHITSYPFSL